MTHSIIDLEGLRRLSGNDEAFIHEILELYSQRTQADIKELSSALERSDWDAVRFIVHRMRSSSVPLGLKELVILLKRIEMELREGSQTKVPEYVQEVLKMAENATEEAQELIKEPSI